MNRKEHKEATSPVPPVCPTPARNSDPVRLEEALCLTRLGPKARLAAHALVDD